MAVNCVICHFQEVDGEKKEVKVPVLSYPSYYYPYDYYNDGYGYGYDYNYGAQGANLALSVQQALARDGYYQGPIDGVMGTRTRSAIRNYERAKGLPVDGLVDRQLLRKMGVG